MKVGLSLSFCIRDILKGEVRATDVAFISSNTKCKSTEDWDEVISIYRDLWWQMDPDRGERLARHFIDNNLVLQPRLEGHYTPTCAGFWIDQEEFNAYVRRNSEAE